MSGFQPLTAPADPFLLPVDEGEQAQQIKWNMLLPQPEFPDCGPPLALPPTSDVVGQQLSGSSLSGSEAFFPPEPQLVLTDFRSAYPAAAPAPVPSPSPELPVQLQLQDWSTSVLPSAELQQGSRMPLPAEIDGESTVFVNVKQYNCILRRRAQRAKAEAQNKVVKHRKPYLHKSRHEHASKRVRGPHGRFLTAEEKEALDNAAENKQSPQTDVPSLESVSQMTKMKEVETDTAMGLLTHRSNREAGREPNLDFVLPEFHFDAATSERQGSGALLPLDDAFI